MYFVLCILVYIVFFLFWGITKKKHFLIKGSGFPSKYKQIDRQVHFPHQRWNYQVGIFVTCPKTECNCSRLSMAQLSKYGHYLRIYPNILYHWPHLDTIPILVDQEHCWSKAWKIGKPTNVLAKSKIIWSTPPPKPIFLLNGTVFYTKFTNEFGSTLEDLPVGYWFKFTRKFVAFGHIFSRAHGVWIRLYIIYYIGLEAWTSYLDM